MTSLLRGGHRKVTIGDKGGGGSQKSQNKGDVLYGRSQTIFFPNCKCLHSEVIKVKVGIDVFMSRTEPEFYG